MIDKKTGIHESTVIIPWWMVINESLTVNGSEPPEWFRKVMTDFYNKEHLSKDADNE